MKLKTLSENMTTMKVEMEDSEFVITKYPRHFKVEHMSVLSGEGSLKQIGMIAEDTRDSEERFKIVHSSTPFLSLSYPEYVNSTLPGSNIFQEAVETLINSNGNW